MTDLTLWRKQEIDKLRKDLDLLFRQFRQGFGVPRALLQADEAFKVELSESARAVTVKARLPGLRPEDIQISVTDDTLTLAGSASENHVEKTGQYERIERHRRSFARTLTMPCRIAAEAVKATYKNDELTIHLPKCEAPKARRVDIETG